MPPTKISFNQTIRRFFMNFLCNIFVLIPITNPMLTPINNAFV